MPKLGDIKKDLRYRKYIWVACVDCGRERWVRWLYGKPRNPRCRRCAKLGENHPRWKGGQTKSHGYIYIYEPTHPKANNWGNVNRSRLVLERKLGRYLLNGYEPHHINRIRDDDRPENLIELSHSEHKSLHRREDIKEVNDESLYL